MAERFVVFSHGKDSEPWGSKIAAMAEIAREEGFQVESVDYRGIDDPRDHRFWDESPPPDASCLRRLVFISGNTQPSTMPAASTHPSHCLHHSMSESPAHAGRTEAQPGHRTGRPSGRRRGQEQRDAGSEPHSSYHEPRRG